MSEIPSEYFDDFYHSLVGTDEQAQRLHEELAERVRNRGETADPFTALDIGVLNAIQGAALEYDNPMRQASTVANGIFGLRLALATLRTLDSLYTTHATVPQEIERVTRATNLALLHLHGIAFGNKANATINIGALMLGRNPRNPLSVVRIGARTLFSPKVVDRRYTHPRSYRVHKDAAGQMDIHPSFKNRGSPPSTTGCPAAHSRVESRGKKRSGLFTLMKVAGGVTVAEIYPNHFPMREATEEQTAVPQLVTPID